MGNLFLNNTNSNIKDILKKLKWLLVAGLVVSFVFFVFSSSSMEKRIVGRWQAVGYDDMYEFTKGGQFVHLNGGGNDGLTIKYSIDGGEIQFDVSNAFGQAVVFADIELSGDDLRISNIVDPDEVFGLDDGESMEFTKAD